MSNNNTRAQNSSLADSNNNNNDDTDFEDVEVESPVGGSGNEVVIEADGLDAAEEEADEEEASAEEESTEDGEEDSDSEENEEESKKPKLQLTEEAFETFLQEKYGITGELLKHGLEFFQQSETAIVTFTYAKAWDVDMKEADARIEKVLDYIESLPEAEQKKYRENGTAQDTMDIWEKIERKSKAKRQYVKSAGTGGGGPARKAYDFTQTQIDRMSDAEYRKNADRIQLAYQQGRVKS